ncbi:damage-inducible protein DinB [Paenibacillus zeisoli]|uniref:Damage-inducible protein DinB n=1 Tax=Paenibacillus zeisoli TaxID=2496267 RepID=A0A3S1E196_9BACL|nr:DinB family protein [Paenibacillus zeisoli]RUT35655.1 damage-inducible protein DinB [Paenibacillus zeisoli]
MNEQILDWYDYNIWASERVFEHLKTLPSDIFDKEVDLGFKSIAEVLSHLASADEVWLDRLQNDSSASIKTIRLTSLEEARIYIDSLQSRMREYVLSIDHPEQIVYYKNSMGQEFQNSVSEIVQHVVNHGTYHRGNISTILRHLGYTSIPTDYIVYLRQSHSSEKESKYEQN